MQNAENPHWQELHRRTVSGDALSVEDQAAYEEGCRALDAGDTFDGNLERIRSLRERIAQAQAEQQRLRRQEQALDERIASLEAHLDDRTRRQLGIGV